MIELTIDNKTYKTNANIDTPLLWIMRDQLNLKGTKFGCGVGQCGACTVLMNGESIRSCSMPISAIGNAKITTIESKEDKEVKKLQKFWIQEDVAQCGYCQSGQIMNAASLLKKNPNPNEKQIVEAMDGNICRCGTYNKIKTAISLATKES